MVVREAVRVAIGSHRSNEMSVEVDRFDRGFDEAGSLKCGADRLLSVYELQTEVD
jgi:hypothetical protein